MRGEDVGAAVRNQGHIIKKGGNTTIYGLENNPDVIVRRPGWARAASFPRIERVAETYNRLPEHVPCIPFLPHLDNTTALSI